MCLRHRCAAIARHLPLLRPFAAPPYVLLPSLGTHVLSLQPHLFSPCARVALPSTQLLAELVRCLSFGKYGADGAFDIKIDGYGLSLRVSEVANTLLKEPKVGKNIPTVAKATQGEVIAFAAAAAEKMRADGMNVLMEGRAQTLNYVRTPHRFELTLSQPLVIGMRRAAQRMMGSALAGLQSGPADSGEIGEAGTRALLTDALTKLSQRP